MSRTILCIVAGPEGYGVRQIWSSLICGMRKSGWNVIIAVLEQRHAKAWMDEFPASTVLTPERSVNLGSTTSGPIGRYASMFSRGLTQLRQLRWLRSVAKQNNVQSLVLQSPLESALAGIVASSLGLKAYWFVPNAIDTTKRFDINRRIYRTLFRHANVIPVSNSNHTDFTFGPGDFERHVVHLGIDTDHYKPGIDATLVRNQFSIRHDVPLLGLFARMTPSKGQLRLIEALSASGTHFHVLLCGGPTEGLYFEALKSRISALGLEQRVHIAGHQRDLRKHYAACDIIVNLLDGIEGFGLTLVEAMACSRPVFAHGAGGPAETVLDGQTGWLIPNSDVATIATGLKRVEADHGHWIEMGIKGRERVTMHFSEEQFQRKAMDLLTQGLKTRSQR